MKIHYELIGDMTKPTLLLIHGLGWTKRIWNEVQEALKEHYRLVMIDLPGHGESEETNKCDFEVIADMIHREIALTPVSNLYVAGSSLGAAVALVYGNKYNADGVILIDGGFTALNRIEGLCAEDMTYEAPPAHAFETMDAYCRFMRSDNPDLWNDYIATAVVDQLFYNPKEGVYKQKASSAIQQDYLEALYYFDPLDALGQLPDSKKITIMVALNEQQQKTDVEEDLLALSNAHRNTDVLFYEGTDHLIMLDKPKRFIEDVRRIIQDIESSGIAD
ncbi:alpha/beta fold hydrolase [Terribacillus saccharophilus]|uniref:alpha/beta fold hydrolase n=1 Tax=Terribacillus saccharophilus TaxID=361277 RepID=UPI002DCF76EB|nr:alpha/beta hydrolase [Terribacillus saccharophilus]MEC0289647.1 alpha/beta hydrolase [Terribacillus saccharophilus]